MDVAIGKFYRFLPRPAWPLPLQQSIPYDSLYFTHPIIALTPTTNTQVDLVHTTSSPNLTSNPSNYLGISHNTGLTGDGNTNMPLSVNAKLSKPSWVVLDSKRRFSVSMLEPWVEKGVHFKLGKQSRKRLVQKVDERMKVLALQQPKPLPPSAVPPQAAPSQTRVGLAPVRKLAAVSPKSEKSLDIQDIKKSLAGLKVAVSALEGLCEKLEARAEGAETSATAEPEGSVQPQMPDRNLCAPRSEASQLSADVQAAVSGTAVQPPSKVSRLKKWSSRIFRTKDQ